MSIQKPKDTGAGAKRKPIVAARRSSKVVKETRSPKTKPAREQNATRPITTQPRKTIARSIPSKRSSSHTSVSQPVRASSKLTTVLAMLRAPGGTTVADIMKATGWQQHSVRGFLTGVVRKRLKLDLASDKADGERRYRIG
ncbi:MAG: DUF3489 domain-containing protein, partial [Afipia sp.]